MERNAGVERGCCVTATAYTITPTPGDERDRITVASANARRSSDAENPRRKTMGISSFSATTRPTSSEVARSWH